MQHPQLDPHHLIWMMYRGRKMLFERKGCPHSKENKCCIRCSFSDLFVELTEHNIAPGWSLGIWQIQTGKQVKLGVLFRILSEE